ncbi:MAG: cytochrome c biogenesis protein CcsA [Chitinophagales bacterium]
MDYIGEHHLPGDLGRFFIVLSFVASLVATFSYFRSAQSKLDTDAAHWKKLARYAFITEAISVFAIFGILFYIIQNHLFEYKYAWQHSSRSLEFKYMFACFWEGQEGSFLLWSLWHCVLGLILIRTSKAWEAPVMAIVSLTQVFLATMIIGIYVFGEKIGSNPFLLLRDTGFFDNAPAMHLNFDTNAPIRPDYMSTKIMQDGNDLNPLLQNYWMVIHPPVLFLGFASTLIPFAFAAAGLWKRNFSGWIKQALPWSLFCAAVLGVGIMMGGKWAYESLNFGGYWAWDPVENASLVPWLIMIAGVHTLLIYKHSGHSLRATYVFLLLSFGFILYSTFLTRTGVLGDTSVHAFTGEGKSLFYHLIVFMAVMMVPSFVLFFINYKKIPAIHKEESASSREFWMFIGSLVFFLTALVIIFKTSLPVLNQIKLGLYQLFPLPFLKRMKAPPEDPEFAYNQIQIFVAIILAVLTAIVQYLKYKSTPARFFWKKIRVPTLIALVLGSLVVVFGNINYEKHGPMFLWAIWLAIVCSIYSIVANAAYIWVGVKGKLGSAGGSISHFGFGLVLLGILLSSSKKEILSYNRGMRIDFGNESKENPGENLTLVKGLPMPMGKYDVTFIGDSAHPKKEQRYYKIHFKSRTDKEEFTLKPDAFVNYKGNEGIMANPDAKHYLDHDIFTYISGLSNNSKPDTAQFQTHILKPGDSLDYDGGFILLKGVTEEPKEKLPVDLFGKDGSLYQASLQIRANTGSVYSLTSRLAIAKGTPLALPDTILPENLQLQLLRVNSDQSIELGVKTTDKTLEFVTLKAYKFPYINVLWIGIVVTAFGILLSMVRRIRQNLANRT